MLAGHSKAEMA
jgi:ribosomal protein L34